MFQDARISRENAKLEKSAKTCRLLYALICFSILRRNMEYLYAPMLSILRRNIPICPYFLYIMEEHGIHICPCLLYIMEEHGIPICPYVIYIKEEHTYMPLLSLYYGGT